mmetsp:Transcript_25727/g.53746  ORF Transcript_25727/g.53746 Transcript_25727/m.53746 type:complete len:99 (-) Transcript_25727:3295-3591(-)
MGIFHCRLSLLLVLFVIFAVIVVIQEVCLLVQLVIRCQFCQLSMQALRTAAASGGSLSVQEERSRQSLPRIGTISSSLPLRERERDLSVNLLTVNGVQ